MNKSDDFRDYECIRGESGDMSVENMHLSRQSKDDVQTVYHCEMYCLKKNGTSIIWSHLIIARPAIPTSRNNSPNKQACFLINRCFASWRVRLLSRDGYG